MESIRRALVVPVALALAGCVTVGVKTSPEPANNNIRTAMILENRGILEKSVKCDAWWPDFLGWGGSGRAGTGPEGFYERNFSYQFRCVKDESESGRSGVGWLLPADEYPRIIDACHLAFRDMIAREGGKITHDKKTGSTFELDYSINEVVGRLRGRIGPMQPPLNAGLSYKENYTSLEVDFREENAPRR